MESENIALVMLSFEIHKMICKVFKYFAVFVKFSSKCPLKIKSSEQGGLERFESVSFIYY